MIKMILDRFKEPSSWAGIGTMLGPLGLTMSPGIEQQVTIILGGVAGLLALLLKERGGN